MGADKKGERGAELETEDHSAINDKKLLQFIRTGNVKKLKYLSQK